MLGEVPEAFRPAEWLSEVIPRKAPYYPQMGDEIIYFRQGHKLYLNAVRNKKVYEVGTRSEPWAKQTIRVSNHLFHEMCYTLVHLVFCTRKTKFIYIITYIQFT